jgi:hypothetical protein
MMRASLVLADFAETDTGTGKVHMIGAGWSMTGPAPSPHAIVAFLHVPMDRVEGGPIPVMIRLVDRSGQVVEAQGPAGMQPLEITGQVEMQVPEGWDRSTELQATFNLQGPDRRRAADPAGHHRCDGCAAPGQELPRPH